MAGLVIRNSPAAAAAFHLYGQLANQILVAPLAGSAIQIRGGVADVLTLRSKPFTGFHVLDFGRGGRSGSLILAFPSTARALVQNAAFSRWSPDGHAEASISDRLTICSRVSPHHWKESRIVSVRPTGPGAGSSPRGLFGTGERIIALCSTGPRDCIALFRLFSDA